MKKLVPILLLIALLLCGCSTMLEKEYVVIEPHNEQYVEDDQSDDLTVENYAGLKNAILNIVEAGLEYGVIRANNYDGDIAQDLADAAYEVARNDPLGAFAIDYLTHDYSRIVSYYEIRLNITYRRSLEDIESIVRVNGDSGLKDELYKLLEGFGTGAVYRFSYYSEKDYQALLDELSQQDPLLECGDPQISVALYPETGVQRIAEVTIQYNDDTEALAEMRQEMTDSIEQNTGGIQMEADDEMKAYRLYRKIVDYTEYDWEAYELMSEGDISDDERTDSAYDALVSHKALSEGIAKAYYLLCREMDIDCMVVHGKNSGYDYAWNIIKVGDEYYHVDCAGAIMDKNRQGYLLGDKDMTSCRWNDELYPACEGTMTIWDILPSLQKNLENDTNDTDE